MRTPEIQPVEFRLGCRALLSRMGPETLPSTVIHQLTKFRAKYPVHGIVLAMAIELQYVLHLTSPTPHTRQVEIKIKDQAAWWTQAINALQLGIMP